MNDLSNYVSATQAEKIWKERALHPYSVTALKHDSAVKRLVVYGYQAAEAAAKKLQEKYGNEIEIDVREAEGGITTHYSRWAVSNRADKLAEQAAKNGIQDAVIELPGGKGKVYRRDMIETCDLRPRNVRRPDVVERLKAVHAAARTTS